MFAVYRLLGLESVEIFCLSHWLCDCRILFSFSCFLLLFLLRFLAVMYSLEYFISLSTCVRLAITMFLWEVVV